MASHHDSNQDHHGNLANRRKQGQQVALDNTG